MRIQGRRPERVWAAALLLSLLLEGSALAAGPDIRGGSDFRPVTLSVLLDLEQNFSSLTLERMRQELEYIMRPLGFRWRWRLTPNESVEEASALPLMARLRGSCAIPELLEPEKLPPSKILGWTEKIDGRMLTFCELDCDQVRRYIQPAINRHNVVRMQFLLGQALGRVLAHELYHILTENRDHGRVGVTKSMLTPTDLVEWVLEFELADVEMIRQNVMRRVEHRLGVWPDLR